MVLLRRIAMTLVVALAPLCACQPAESQTDGSDRDRPQQDGPPFSTHEWDTNFAKHSVPYDEILSGGPPKDGIPAIDDPKFVPVEEADEWIGGREPIIVFEHDGEVHGYPLQILMWHEIVNDEVGGLPVAVTFCPLCNTAIAFDRRVGDRVLDFGTTGKLRHSDLVMYDRQTESWWQQATGEAIVGDLTGTQLRFLAAPTISWSDFTARYPDGDVLSRDTGHRRDYGRNPYTGYDTGRPFAFRGKTDGRLPMMARVDVVQVDDAAVVFPRERLAEEKVVNHEVGGTPVVLLYQEGTASALDAGRIRRGREVGATTAFERTVDGRTLTFRVDGDGFRDEETGTRWNFFGEAVEGPLVGNQLEEVVHFTPFWFAWAAFRPETPIYGE